MPALCHLSKFTSSCSATTLWRSATLQPLSRVCNSQLPTTPLRTAVQPPLRRFCSSSQLPTYPPTQTPTQPPFPMRVALVGATVGLATPLLALGGVVFAWYRFLPLSAGGRGARAAISVLIGGGVATLTWSPVGPFLLNHADLVQPFALANTIAASFWYAALEARLGLQTMAGRFEAGALPAIIPPRLLPSHISIPVGGLAVGLLTGASAAFLWPACIRVCWPDEMRELLLGRRQEATHLIDLYLQLAVPVGLPLAALAGYGLHGLLADVLLRTATPRPWTATSLPLLAAVLGAGALYFGTCSPYLEDLFWESRIDPSTGAVASRRPNRTKGIWDLPGGNMGSA
jgi:hypothetical protein